MSSTNLYRYGGLALIVGAVLGIIGEVVTNLVFPGNDPTATQNSTYVAFTAILLIGELLLLIGMPSIPARQATHATWLSPVGFALTLAGGIMFTGFTIVTLVIFPWIAQAAPNLMSANAPPPSGMLTFFLSASILFGLGGLLLGIDVMRAGVLPRTAGLLLMIGAILNAANFPLQGLLGSIVGTVSFVLFAVALAWMGYAMYAERRLATRIA
jgi:hypothetical protein